MLFIPPILKYVEDFTVTGFSVVTQNRDELNAETEKLPNLWQQFYLSELGSNPNLFEVYSDYESDANGLFTVTVGIANHSERAQFSSVKIQAGNYLVFQGEGSMPSTVVELWKQIWNYFELGSKYKRNFISDFEEYRDSDKVAIYIGVQ